MKNVEYIFLKMIKMNLMDFVQQNFLKYMQNSKKKVFFENKPLPQLSLQKTAAGTNKKKNAEW